jgi:O-antigen/teichoic acid export membrane protein
MNDNDVSINNKRIAKNTLFLYIRMILVMGVSLFTVRIILNALGVVDYGIYNVVGGITLLFVFLSNTMAHASQRFFSYELGRGDRKRMKAIFKTNMTIYAFISVVVIVLTETFGLWFLNARMVIPTERMDAANWIYQFSILSFVVSMFSVPYQSVILSREKMSVFAYISILEALAKLLVAYLMVVVICDKLKLYAVLQFMVISGFSLLYILMFSKRYEECCFAFNWNKKYLKEVLSYTGWSFYGHASMNLRNQGVNIVLNLFFGPVVNTARGIAFQVNAAITSFYMNFYMAAKPQIIKYYAQNNLKEMHRLIYRSSKWCYFLMMVVSIPLLLETPYIMQLWLVTVPDYAVLFTRIIIVTAMIDSITLGLSTSADATGKIRNYQLVVGSIILINVPLCWLFLKWDFPPQSAMYIVLCVSVVVFFIKLLFAKKMVNLSVKIFFTNVLLTIATVTLISLIVPTMLLLFVDGGFARLCLTLSVSIIWSCGMVFLLGFSKNEKLYFISICKNKYNLKS